MTNTATTCFSVPSWKDQVPNPLKKAAGDSPPDWRALADALDVAKRQASLTFACLQHDNSDKARSAWTHDEVAVLRARVGLLNAFMTRPPRQPPCIEHAVGDGPRVCVMYNRMRCDGEEELGPMQSTMAWAVEGAGKPMQHILTTGEAHQPDALHDLLAQIRASMPVRRKTDTLGPLHDLLGLAPPARLLHRPELAGQNGMARVMEGPGASGGEQGLAPMYRLGWGTLDVSAQEAWQNPSTNAAIRLSILDTAQQAVRQAALDKGALWSAAAFLQIRVLHGEESHVLSITPFWDSESCTVTHLQYAQSMFDPSGPERGILNLSHDPASIHAIPLGKMLPLRSYACPGAHRKSRLNEGQLNYVHAQGILAHEGFDTKLLPTPESLKFEPGGRIPAAKSTRVSAAGLDVLATSYHIADQVYTTISIVQYPPFGTQFEQVKAREEAKAQTPLSSTKRSVRATKKGLRAGDLNPTAPRYWSPNAPDFQPNPPAPNDDGQDERDWGDYDEEGEGEEEEEEEDEQSVDYSDSETGPPPITEWNTGGRYDRSRRNKVLYKMTRIPYHPTQNRFGLWVHKPDTWTKALKIGQHFFIDGVSGTPTSYKDLDLERRWVLFEVDNGLKYLPVQQHNIEARDNIIQQFSNEWDHTTGFYTNLLRRHKILRYWQNYWQKYIADSIVQIKKQYPEGMMPRAFWYCPSQTAWGEVMAHNPDMQTKTYVQWERETANILDYWKSRGHILDKDIEGRTPLYLLSRQPSPTRKREPKLAAGQIRLPRQTSKDSHKTDDPRLTHRIDALEHKLQQAKQDSNTQQLLLQVLDRLDTLPTPAP